MFGFIRKKIKSFTDAFSEEAEEEVVEEPIEESSADAKVEGSAAGTETVSRTDESDAAEAIEESDGSEVSEPKAGEASESESVSEAAIETVETRHPSQAADDKPSADIAKDAATVAEPEVEVQTPGVADTGSDRKEAEASITAAGEASGTTDADATDTRTSADAEAVETEAPAMQERETVQPETVEEAKPEKRGLRERFMGALTKRTLNDDRFESLFADLEIGLLEANTAYDAVQAVKENLRERLTGERVSRFSAAADVSQALKESIAELFETPEDLIALADAEAPLVIMLIGINGSGKTTSAAKLARAFQKAGKTPVLAAADTFRAAAIQQLEAHATALDCRIIKHDYGADPAAVAFDAIAHAKSGKADVVLIDTAGRLHSNENLLKELEKVKRVAKPHRIIFVGESIAGNDLLEQAETFNERVGIDGIILTKADVDESGGGALSVSYVTKKPIDYFGSGQSYDDLEPFTVDRMAQLLGLE